MKSAATINSPKLIQDLASEISARKKVGQRLVVGIAGAPSSGKSTLAAEVVDQLNQDGQSACLLPMDGFHLDNVILKAKGLLDVKGSPQTFDFRGFQNLMAVFGDRSSSVYYPTFDRGRDLAIAGSGVIEPADEIVVAEGNYLLLNLAPWKSLKSAFDFTIFIETPLEELKKRLVQRWVDNGYDTAGATKRAMSNDIPNAELVCKNQLVADQTIQQ